jgi:phage terminase large subunit-like protein
MTLTAEAFRSLPRAEQEGRLSGLSPEALAYLRYDWSFWARPDQLPPPGDWFVWEIWAGRGWGKSRTGAEWIKAKALKYPKTRWALVGETFGDVRDTMVEGDSGLLSIMREEDLRGGDVEKAWNRTLGELNLANGSFIRSYSAEKSDRLRGPQFHGAWCDEPGKWKDAPAGMENDTTWMNLMMCLRLRLPDGSKPQCVVTGTTKTVKLVRQLIAKAKDPASGFVRNDPRRASSHENLVNLSPHFKATVLAQYQGTRLGRQEIQGELLSDNPSGLWNADNLEENRRPKGMPSGVDLTRVVIGVDPAGSIADMARFAAGLDLEDSNNGDDAGIIAAGLGTDGHAYVLGDHTVGGSPNLWGHATASAYARWAADRVVGESNHGGDNVERVLRTVDRNISYKKVNASRAKSIRAEPVAALYEQKKVHHVGEFSALEDELLNWVPGLPSPNRLDALVFCLTELMLDGVVASGTVVEDDPFGYEDERI